MRLSLKVLITLSLALSFGENALIAQAAPKTDARSMTTEFVCKTTVPALPAGTKEASLWIPAPSDSEWQKVESLVVEGAPDYEINQENRYKNRMVYVHLDATQTPLTVTVRYVVNRKEMRVLGDATRHPQKESTKFLKMNLMGEKSLPIGGAFPCYLCKCDGRKNNDT